MKVSLFLNTTLCLICSAVLFLQPQAIIAQTQETTETTQETTETTETETTETTEETTETTEETTETTEKTEKEDNTKEKETEQDKKKEKEQDKKKQKLVAVDDSVTVTAGKAEVIDVLANDKGNGIKVSNVFPAAQGQALLDKTGEIVYISNSDAGNSDSFLYEIIDINGKTAQANVFITISGETKLDSIFSAVTNNTTLIETNAASLGTLSSSIDSLVNQTNTLSASIAQNSEAVLNASAEILAGLKSVSDTIDTNQNMVAQTLSSIQQNTEQTAGLIEANAGLIASASESAAAQLSSLNAALLNAEQSLTGAIQSLQSELADTTGLVAANAGLIGTASDSLHTELSLLQSQISANTEKLSSRIDTLQETLHLKLEDVLQSVVDSKAELSAKVDGLTGQLDTVHNAVSLIGGTVIDIHLKVQQLAEQQNRLTDPEIEKCLANRDAIALLLLPASLDGQLDDVTRIVEARIIQFTNAGLSTGNAQHFFENGLEALNAGNYGRAYNQFTLAYQQLLKGQNTSGGDDDEEDNEEGEEEDDENEGRGNRGRGRS